MQSPASAFRMVQCNLQPVHLGWYNELSGWSIWNGTMGSPAGAFGMVQCNLRLVHLGWYNELSSRCF
jgi:hypothetical protein